MHAERRRSRRNQANARGTYMTHARVLCCAASYFAPKGLNKSAQALPRAICGYPFRATENRAIPG